MPAASAPHQARTASGIKGMGATPTPRRQDGEASVSDVLGSILLVGITVIMAGAFGAVLLAYDGPSDQTHAQLGVSVGPGADGDWGTNDAELKIVHLGGEPLDDARLTITYVDASGTHQVSPTFTGGILRVGHSWTQVVSAAPGDSVAVTIVARFEDATGSAVLSSGSVAAGGAGATLTYVASITPASGSVADLANAQSAIDVNAYATLTEGAVGGTPTASDIAPTATSNSGAANAGNVLSSNDQHAVLDSSNEYVQGQSFSAPGGALQVSAISMGMEAKAVPAVSTVTHVATATGTSSGIPSVSTAAILASSGEILVAAIANGATNLRTVTGISGPTVGYTWTQVGTQANSAGTGRLEVWVGTGTPTIAGIITASFSGNADRAAISVSRYSGADTSSPVQASLAGEASGSGGTAVSLGPVAGTASTGVFFAAVNGVSATGSTGCSFTSPSNERADVDPGGGNQVQLCAAGGTAAASNTLSATISSSADWQAILLTIKPFSTPLPTVTLSYRLSSATGATTLSTALTASDAQYTQSIVGDRSWTVADLANLDVRVTYPSDSGSDVHVDQVYFTVTYTTTPTTYTTQADLAFSAVVDQPTQVFQMRYKVTGDTFYVYAMTGSTERQCPGSLNSAIFAVYTCTLEGTEYNSGAPVLRIKDATTSGTTQGTVLVEYARMSSS